MEEFYCNNLIQLHSSLVFSP